ncbi:FAD-dependent oxidoreductase [Pseudonocardia acaciae]|uniref:FAD-dependent oxidoreductase n=1 Tax=Pseudonocardia acaciae TaxID=551276 RepID=UPI00048B86AA|nr:FAD-dependent oxidoreductase [Pseudonocardia acaciae]
MSTDVTDVLVIGSGIAGLSAAVAAAEELGGAGSVVVLDRAPRAEAGGNTRWTAAYFRLDDVYEPGPNFVDDVIGFSDGRTPRWYVDALLERLPETMEWIQGHGARFRRMPTYFINSTRPRLQPVGGGEGLLSALRPAAERLGVTFRYETTAHRLVTGDGAVTGVEVTGPDGGRATLPARTVVIASGGFEGDTAYLGEQLGADAGTLLPIAPSVRLNRGEGIRMALAAGAARAGQWDTFHAEPVDPRSKDAEALVMVFPYGILVDRGGERFIDEARGTVDETYESTARAIWSRDGGTAWFITDQSLRRVDDHERGLLTGVPPVRADTVSELATALDLPPEVLADTIDRFNAATPTVGSFDWRRPDGLATVGLEPAKSNWALPLVSPPFLAYPVACSIVFTFGGLATDVRARVVREDGGAIDGLYAAGECTGLYHGKYPGGTSVLRGMVYGRVAGTDAARSSHA